MIRRRNAMADPSHSSTLCPPNESPVEVPPAPNQLNSHKQEEQQCEDHLHVKKKTVEDFKKSFFSVPKRNKKTASMMIENKNGCLPAINTAAIICPSSKGKRRSLLSRRRSDEVNFMMTTVREEFINIGMQEPSYCSGDDMSATTKNTASLDTLGTSSIQSTEYFRSLNKSNFIGKLRNEFECKKQDPPSSSSSKQGNKNISDISNRRMNMKKQKSHRRGAMVSRAA